MISLPSGTRIWLVAGVTDMRKSFNGLGELVQHALEETSFSGQRPLRQTRTRKPFPESLPRDEKRLLPAAPSGLSGSCGKNTPAQNATLSCRLRRLHAPSSGVSPDQGCCPVC